MSPPRTVRHLVVAIAILAGLAVAGCGGGKHPPAAKAPKATPTPAPVKPITSAAAGRITARMARPRVLEILGPPVLTQDPFRGFAGGCIFYPMAGPKGKALPLANVWQFCFNQRGVSVILTAIATQQPAPPKGASQARAALIGRADTVCQSQNGHLRPITKAVAAALSAYGRRDSPATVKAVSDELGRFVGNLNATHAQLQAFQAPPDQRPVFAAYLRSLDTQAQTLAQARTAFARGDQATYDAKGRTFTQVGKAAIRQARAYGLTTCSASTFGSGA